MIDRNTPQPDAGGAPALHNSGGAPAPFSFVSRSAGASPAAFPLLPNGELDYLAYYGVTEAELDNPGAAMLSGGLKKMWSVLKALEYRADLKHRDHIRSMKEQGRLAECDHAQAFYDRSQQESVPVWQKLCGIFPDQEKALSPAERMDRIATLIDAVERLARYEMNAVLQRTAASGPRTPDTGLRTFLWDPLPTICYYLGIARSKLTAYSKELTGLSAHELIDRIRAEKIRAKMKRDIAAFMETAGRDAGPTNPLAAWNALRAARRSPEFHRGTWAIEHGFPNYQRFYRACLLFYGQAPSQLEFAVIGEVLSEHAAAPASSIKEEAAREPVSSASAHAHPPDVQFITGNEPSAPPGREISEGAPM